MQLAKLIKYIIYRDADLKPISAVLKIITGNTIEDFDDKQEVDNSSLIGLELEKLVEFIVTDNLTGLKQHCETTLQCDFIGNVNVWEELFKELLDSSLNIIYTGTFIQGLRLDMYNYLSNVEKFNNNALEDETVLSLEESRNRISKKIETLNKYFLEGKVIND